MLNAILGGVLIGSAVSILLLFNGRVTGISGIVGGLFTNDKENRYWRLSFILGLMVGGLFLAFYYPTSLEQKSSAITFDYILAGLLVGFGTQLGSGCTSGHGVCGISRLSIRSIVATSIFILFGVLSVIIFKKVRGEI